MYCWTMRSLNDVVIPLAIVCLGSIYLCLSCVHALITYCQEPGSKTSASFVRRWLVIRSHLKSDAKASNSRWYRITGFTDFQPMRGSTLVHLGPIPPPPVALDVHTVAVGVTGLTGVPLVPLPYGPLLSEA